MEANWSVDLLQDCGEADVAQKGEFLGERLRVFRDVGAQREQQKLFSRQEPGEPQTSRMRPAPTPIESTGTRFEMGLGGGLGTHPSDSCAKVCDKEWDRVCANRVFLRL